MKLFKYGYYILILRRTNVTLFTIILFINIYNKQRTLAMTLLCFRDVAMSTMTLTGFPPIRITVTMKCILEPVCISGGTVVIPRYTTRMAVVAQSTLTVSNSLTMSITNASTALSARHFVIVKIQRSIYGICY